MMHWRKGGHGGVCQVVLVLAAVLPLREFDPQLALDMLTEHHQRNHAASLSHRKRRIALATQRE